VKPVRIYYEGAWSKRILNLFSPTAFDRPLKLVYSHLEDNEKFLCRIPRVHTLVVDQDIREQELLKILHRLKPYAIEMRGFIKEDATMIKERT
jgi:hypothetical protein